MEERVKKNTKKFIIIQRTHQVKRKSKRLYFVVMKIKMMIFLLQNLFIDVKNKNKVILTFR